LKINKFFVGFLTGTIICLLAVYFVFDYFSWSFTGGYLAGIIIFALLLKLIRGRNLSKD